MILPACRVGHLAYFPLCLITVKSSATTPRSWHWSMTTSYERDRCRQFHLPATAASRRHSRRRLQLRPDAIASGGQRGALCIGRTARGGGVQLSTVLKTRKQSPRRLGGLAPRPRPGPLLTPRAKSARLCTEACRRRSGRAQAPCRTASPGPSPSLRSCACRLCLLP